jgi:pyruvate kinase
VHPSLEIDGTLTGTDRSYLAAMANLGLRHTMLSYVESPADVDEVEQLLPGAEILLKIESQKGLGFTRAHGASKGRLMAARGDLYVEVVRPHRIVSALRDIITADPEAVAASRILESLAHDPVPASADIGDVAFLLSLGYRTFMLGDAVCFHRDSVLEALNLLQAIAAEFLGRSR